MDTDSTIDDYNSTSEQLTTQPSSKKNDMMAQAYFFESICKYVSERALTNAIFISWNAER